MLLANAALSALLNLIVLGGVPFAAYFAYQKGYHRRSFGEILRRAGLQRSAGRYVAFSAVLSLAVVAAVVIWPPPIDPFLRDGSPQQPFAGLGLNELSVSMALLYGFIKTGLPEELLFRGLIAGSLSRRLPLLWANLAQTLLFMIPHFFVLLVMPEMWGILPVIFAGALILGWIRIKSGSIMGPWLIHATANVAMCLSVAIRTAG